MTKFIRIGIADKNDNPPYFDKSLYEAEVDENEDIQHTVLTVTAKDHDECKCIPTQVVTYTYVIFVVHQQQNLKRKMSIKMYFVFLSTSSYALCCLHSASESHQ